MVRLLNKRNLSEVRQIAEMISRTTVETIPEARAKRQSAWHANPVKVFEMLKGLLKDPAYRFLVDIDRRGELRGHVMLKLEKSERELRWGHIVSIYVKPDYRRGGTARRFVRNAENWFRRSKATYVQAETHSNNKALQTLLKEAGFLMTSSASRPYPHIILTKLV